MPKTVDINQVPIPWEQRPPTISWVDRLNATQAVQQCEEWNLPPAETLEQNRTILKNHIREAPRPPQATPPPIPPRVTPPRATNSEIPQRESPQINATPPSDPNWLQMVQITAQAIGDQIAAAITSSQPQTPAQTNMHSLPQALSDMVKSMPQCSGGDAHKLLDFLIACQKLYDLNLTENKQLLIAILPKTSGLIRTSWVRAIAQNTDLKQLCQDIVQFFMPDPTRLQLINDAVFRSQAPTESLTDFILSIQDAARILLQPNSDLLPTIRTKLNSKTRARLAGLPPPLTVDQLLQLAPEIEVIRQTEQEETKLARDQQHPPTNHQYNAHYRRQTPHPSQFRRPFINWRQEYSPAPRPQPSRTFYNRAALAHSTPPTSSTAPPRYPYHQSASSDTTRNRDTTHQKFLNFNRGQ